MKYSSRANTSDGTCFPRPIPLHRQVKLGQVQAVGMLVAGTFFYVNIAGRGETFLKLRF